jgi:hypothetical protein
MTRARLLGGALLVGVVLLGVLIARNTDWVDVPVPTPPRGEAITNPFYAAQRFAEELGARTRRERTLVLPAADAVLVLSAWHWNLSAQRQAAIERWVESGGRLVVDRRLGGDLSEFAEWSGIAEDYNVAAADEYYEDEDAEERPECVPVPEAVPDSGDTYVVCDLDFSFLTTTKPVEWALRDSAGYQALRVAVGQGSVTVVNNVPFTERLLFDGDHAYLFVAAAELERGDEIVFLSEEDHDSLLGMLWQYGAPAVVLSLILVALVLWRGAVRFGPPLAAADPPRRSMAEQIRGTGRFVLQHGDGVPLHTASVRALSEVARRRIPAYARMARKQRATVLGKFTGMDGEAIVSAIEDVSKRRPNELRNTLGLLESARRQLLNPSE